MTNAQETNPLKVPISISAPQHANWTQRDKETGKPAEYEHYDQVWVGSAPVSRVAEARILRRKKIRRVMAPIMTLGGLN